jgi:hypothetical protein
LLPARAVVSRVARPQTVGGFLDVPSPTADDGVARPVASDPIERAADDQAAHASAAHSRSERRERAAGLQPHGFERGKGGDGVGRTPAPPAAPAGDPRRDDLASLEAACVAFQDDPVVKTLLTQVRALELALCARRQS